MHIIFINPQGNFDQNDSHLTEHPDFGGQLIYVKELCMALSKAGISVDIVTRKIVDPDWPEFSEGISYYEGFPDNPRIVRIGCGGPLFIDKEQLWRHLDEFTDNILEFYGNKIPDFSTAHYADGGYSGVLLQKKAGIGFTFTAHSLGAQKIDNLSVSAANFDSMENRFKFSRRITAERLSMERAAKIITSTSQERFEQYSHPLYNGAVDVGDKNKFSVIPPGVNTEIFTDQERPGDRETRTYIEGVIREDKKPFIILSSRLVKKKNHLGTVKAFASSERLKELCSLGIFLRGIDDPYAEFDKVPDDEQILLRPVLDLIDREGIRDKVYFFNIRSRQNLAASYRYFAQRGSIFSLTAFYEPFGLAPVEAAACGLAVVATKNGGQSEVFGDGSGILVDPSDVRDIANGLIQGLTDHEYFARRGLSRVSEKYTWDKTASSYLDVVKSEMQRSFAQNVSIPDLDSSDRILRYLSEKMNHS